MSDESSEKEGESGPGEGEMLYKLRAIERPWFVVNVHLSYLGKPVPFPPSHHPMDRSFIPANPSASPTPRGRGRGTGSTAAKRGRKPRAGAGSPHPPTTPDVASPSTPLIPSVISSPATAAPIQWTAPVATSPTVPVVPPPVTPAVDATVVLPTTSTAAVAAGVQRPIGAMEEEAEAEDELLPAMADDDYSAQLSWQSQSKDNLKYVLFIFTFHFALSLFNRVLMDNFTPEQYERFEAYRRHALPKQAVRKV